MDFTKLKNSTSKILVIGDIMIDQYYRGDVKRISPESPVPVFNYKDSYYRPGGAANVAANIAAITQRVSLMGVIGNDIYGNRLKEILRELNIDYRFVTIDNNRKTIVKTRLLAQNNQQMIRVDLEDDSEVSNEIQDSFLEKLRTNIDEFEIVVVSDYLKGLLTEKFLQGIIEICNCNKKRVIIDIKGRNLAKYKGAYLLKPNRKELEDILRCNILNNEELINAARRLKSEAKVKAVLVTCGENGMVLVNENDEINHILTSAREVFDVTGAGDTVLSYLSCAIANGISLYESAKISNVAAGIKVGKVGTSVVRLDEVEALCDKKLSYKSKIIKLEEYMVTRKEHEHKSVVFTNGCFDILHVGHIRYLKRASDMGDILVVGVNSDNSVRRLKGEKRPIVSEEDRMEMLAGLSFVNYVIKFDEETPYELIKSIKPNVLAKGGDYKIEDVVGKDIVEGNGGKVVLIPFEEGFSTTSIVEKILSTYNMQGGK